MTYSHSLKLILSAIFASIAFLLIGIQYAAAQTPTLVLTINGGSNATIVNGQSVDLAWYIDGAVTNCSINNGVGPIDVSVTPASGSLTVTPPANTSTNYQLNCDGLVDAVTVSINPIVTMSVDGGSPQSLNPLTAQIDYQRVRWDAQFATRCGPVSREEASSPGTIITATNNAEYNQKYQTNGWVNYRGWPHGYIDETTTFFITCYNDVTGAQATGSVTLVVNNPAPPPMVTMNMWTNTPTAYRDPVFGYAVADVRFNSQGTTWCSYSAAYADGTIYSNPSGYGHWGGHQSGNFTKIRLSTTTDFTITCSRGSVTIAGIPYPSTSTSRTVRVVVDDAGADLVPSGPLPPVSVSASATPNPAVKHPITGQAQVQVDVWPQNADYCYFRAYRWDNGDADYTDEYSLKSWTRNAPWSRAPGNNYQQYGLSVSTSTRLEVDCLREYDLIFGTPTEVAEATEQIDIIITTIDSVATVPPTQTYIYGHAYAPNQEQLWNTRVSAVGYTGWHGQRGLSAPASSSNSITFPFVHPTGGSDTYDIHIQYCEETDGVSNYRFLDEGGTLLDSWTTDSALAIHDDCDYDTYETRAVATGLTLNDGDLFTIECDSGQDGEWCRVLRVVFGAGGGDGATVVATQDSVTGFATSSIAWVGARAEKCSASDAFTPGGVTYPWYNGNNKVGWVSRNISTTTTFTINCWNNFNGTSDESDVTFALPVSTSLSTGVDAATGECLDPGTLTPVTTPPGYQPNPSTGVCEPAVDLAAVSPALSGLASAVEDNVAGTYDGVVVLTGIENYGPGALAANSSISYMANMTFAPVYSLPVLNTVIGDFDDPMSAPSGLLPTVSPTLSRSFDNVPFGTHTVCSRVNLDGSPNYPESNPDPSNNTSCGTITLPVPEPPMSLVVDREVIRSEQAVSLTWSVNVTYELNCTVRGAGGLNTTFDTLTTGPAYTDSFTTSPLDSTSEFIFQCTEPITGTSFAEQLTVEVVDGGEEI